MHRSTAVSLLLALGIATGTAFGPITAQADFLDQRTAVAKPDPFFGSNGKPQKLDFDFGDIKGWIRDRGGYHIEGYVGHDSLLCGTYELGIRFGVGKNGCEDVHWLDETVYLSRRTQCNNATVFHSASEYNAKLADAFSKINCAERSLRCTGNCTTYVAPASSGVPGSTPPSAPLFDQ